MIITTETKIFGSFSSNPGNNGAKFFNEAFQEQHINAVYIPIKCDITDDVFSILRLMNFSGAALSSPHKINALRFVDVLDKDAEEIGAINTVLVKNNLIYGYNTDWVGVYSILNKSNIKQLYIYGSGGFSLSVQHACRKLSIPFRVFGRNEEIPSDNTPIFNATPSVLKKGNIIDGRPSTIIGQEIFLIQAKLQYGLYTE
jgi:shikimate 5-dehydrogenase